MEVWAADIVAHTDVRGEVYQGMLKVDTAYMQNEASEISTIVSQLDAAARDLAGVNSALRWQAAVTASVRSTLTQYQTNLSSLSRRGDALVSVLLDSADLYRQAEEGLCGVSTSVEESAENSGAGSGQSSDEDDTFISLVKAMLDNLAFWGEDKNAGLLSGLMGYYNDLVAFFTGDKTGLSGASDLCSLLKSSLKSWKGLYDGYASVYHSETGMFSDVMNKNVAVVGLSAGVAGFISSFLSASDGLSEKSGWTALADYLDECGSDAVSVVKSAYKVENFSSLKSLTKTEKFSIGLDLYIYGAIADAAISTVSQGIRSYETYYADGVWDANDTAALGVDVSMAGIYALSHKLSFGLDDVIFGIVDTATGGDGTDDLSYAEKAAEGWKIIGQNIADSVADWCSNLIG